MGFGFPWLPGAQVTWLPGTQVASKLQMVKMSWGKSPWSPKVTRHTSRLSQLPVIELSYVCV